MTRKVIHGGAIHDGIRFVECDALMVDGTVPVAYLQSAEIPAGVQNLDLKGGTLMPAFVDVQVNGAGGVMFNSDPSKVTLDTMTKALRSVGTAHFMATLISDTKRKTAAAIDAAAGGVAGVVGLHLEGPHLALAKKGAHSEDLIRTMDDDDLKMLLDGAARIPNLMVTVAPEAVTSAQIEAMVKAGIVVSLGHSNASFEDCIAAMDAGATCTTHLFNAMSQMEARKPGLVGATLSKQGHRAGIIADGIHVHPASIRAAMSDDLFLVTDAMATIGSDIGQFELNGRTICREGNRLTLKDGTLAGAHLDFPTALKVVVDDVGVDAETAIAMATSRPAGLLKDARQCGRIELGKSCEMVMLDMHMANPKLL